MRVISVRLTKQCFATLTFLLPTLLMTASHAAAQGARPQEKVLIGFRTGQAGNEPSGGLIRDTSGNFYGVTQAGGIGGNGGNGTVYEVSPAANGGWTAKALYLFHPGTQDGQDPLGGL